MPEVARETPLLVAHPRLAPPGRIHVWVGAFERRTAPALEWKLDGVPVIPASVRPLASARQVPDQVSATTVRAFTGIFEVAVPDLATHTLEVSTQGDTPHTLRVATLPTELPTTESDRFPERWLNVLLVSCFHWATNEGLVGQVVRTLPHELRPHLTLLLGDQVYLDLPTLKDFPDDVVRLGAKFEEDYRRNWRESSALADVLAIAPSVAIPDDHEFWNNYPHRSPIIQNSYSDGGRQRWRSAAQTLYEAFQAPWSALGPTGPFAMGDPAVFDVAPLSFCLADTRTFRDYDLAGTLRPGALASIATWAARVKNDRLIPVFGTGQSLLRDAIGSLKGSVADYELPNYGDHRALFEVLRPIATPERKLLLLTGDVHWGRVSTGTGIASKRDEVVEVISSPSALVESVFVDQASDVLGWVGSLFGRDNHWPRHSDADETPSAIPSGGGAFFNGTQVQTHKGNQVVVLSFRRAAGGVTMRITYAPLHRELRFQQPVTLDEITLS